MEIKDVVRLALDLTRGTCQKYSIGEGTDVLRQALIAANGGSAKYDRKAMRRNKVQIFEIIEEIIPSMVEEGFSGDEFWMNYVDERNLSAGDAMDFDVPDKSTFIVSEIADGIATPRRQRLGVAQSVTVTPKVHYIRIYEEFSRFMAGRIDWATLCEKVAKSFQAQIWTDIYTAFSGITASTIGMNSTYVQSGSYSESTLLTLIEHIEAATGERAVIVGTKAALNKCKDAEQSNDAKNAMLANGFYGMFKGTPMVCLSQKHQAGTDTFILSDNTVYVLAGGDKFIKYVTSGETYIDDRDYTQNADQTLEYRVEANYAVAIAIAGAVGKYTMS